MQQGSAVNDTNLDYNSSHFLVAVYFVTKSTLVNYRNPTNFDKYITNNLFHLK